MFPQSISLFFGIGCILLGWKLANKLWDNSAAKKVAWTIALFPSLISLLPKPGKWMETLKQLFGFMMFGAAIWLLWVLANQVDANSLLLVLVGWFLAAFIIWLSIIKFKYNFKNVYYNWR